MNWDFQLTWWKKYRLMAILLYLFIVILLFKIDFVTRVLRRCDKFDVIPFDFQGVMMSHDNLTWTARTAVHYLNVDKDDKLVNILSVQLQWNSVVNEHSVITNRFLNQIGYFSIQINPVIPSKNGRSRAVRYNPVSLYFQIVQISVFQLMFRHYQCFKTSSKTLV